MVYRGNGTRPAAGKLAKSGRELPLCTLAILGTWCHTCKLFWTLALYQIPLWSPLRSIYVIWRVRSLRGVDWSWIAGEARVAALWGSWCDCPCCWDLEATGVMCVFGGKLVMQQTKHGLCTQCPDLGCGSWQAWGFMSCTPTPLLPAKYSITWVFCSLGNLTLLTFLL